MSENKKSVLRASEIGTYTYCPQAFLLLKKGIPATQTLQDLQQNRIKPVLKTVDFFSCIT